MASNVLAVLAESLRIRVHTLETERGRLVDLVEQVYQKVNNECVSLVDQGGPTDLYLKKSQTVDSAISLLVNVNGCLQAWLGPQSSGHGSSPSPALDVGRGNRTDPDHQDVGNVSAARTGTVCSTQPPCDIKELSQAVKEIRVKMSNFEKYVSNSTSEVQALQVKVTTMQSDIGNAMNEIKDTPTMEVLHKERQSLASEITDLRHGLATLEREKVKAVEDRVTALREEMKTLRQEKLEPLENIVGELRTVAERDATMRPRRIPSGPDGDRCSQQPGPSGLACNDNAVNLELDTTHGQAEPEWNPLPPGAGLGDIPCSKHPNHPEFIPASQISLDHLPEEFRQRQVLDLIKSYVPLVVCLEVKHVSKERPDVYPDTNQPFPLYSLRGGRQYRTGSGCVNGVIKCGEGGVRRVGERCCCQECRESGNRRTKWWEVGILTAANVVYDQSEVVNTEVRFFYDEKECRRHVAKGYECLGTDVVGDLCRFKVIVHDKEVGERLERARECVVKCRREYERVFVERAVDRVFVISHPHGCSKFITIGTKVREIEGDDGDNKFITYTAPTCPGSSGGLVLLSGRFGGNPAGRALLVHSSALPDGTNKGVWLWGW